MGRTKELLEQLELVTIERDVHIAELKEMSEERAIAYTMIELLRKQRAEARAATDVWRSRWQSLDKDFQDLVDDFHTSENEVIKLSIEVESLKTNQK